MAIQHQRRTSAFEVRGEWSAQEKSGAIALGGAQTAAISVPQAFGGTEAGTNPEELLLASALSCYLMTLARTLTQRNLGGLHVEAAIVGEVSRTPYGLQFDRIRLRPVVHGSGHDSAERQRIEQALLDAEDACFIARTLRPVIPYSLEPSFVD